MSETTKSEREQRRTERFDLRAIYETSRLLTSSLDLGFILDNLLLISMSKLLVTRGAVLLWDDLHGALRVSASKGISTLSKGETVPGLEWPEGAYAMDEDIPEAFAWHKIKLVLPIQVRTRRIGMICLGKPATGGTFSSQQLEFIQSLVNLSANAIQNARMVDELQVANRELDNKIQKLNTLFDLSREFSGANLNRDLLLKLLSFAVMGQLLVQRYMFLLRRPEQGEKAYEIVTAKGVSQDPLAEDLCDTMCELRNIVLLEELKDQEPWKDLYDRGLRLVVPLRLQDEVRGVLSLGAKMTGQDYTQADVEFASALGSLALTSLQNSYLVEEMIEKERMEEEMRLATVIQERLLPNESLHVEMAEVAFASIPARHVGGDYFDVQFLDEDRLLVAIADVTGKGIPAALLMSNIQACLQLFVASSQGVAISEATARINRVICRNTDADKFITFFWGIYDRRDHSFTYVNAGHDNPMLLRTDGSMERLDKGGLLLGVLEMVPYDEGKVMLNPGDVIAMYTDGITEAMNNEKELYEEERLIDHLDNVRLDSATDILSTLMHEVETFADGAPPSDDRTVVILKAI